MVATSHDVMPDIELYQPTDEANALALANTLGSDGWLLAGGQDTFGWLKDRNKATGAMIELTQIDAWKGIRETADGVEIGAVTTLTEIAKNPIIQKRYGVLARAAGVVASPQIRNVGTLGGNLNQDARCWYYRHPGLDCFKSGGDSCPARTGRHLYGVVFDNSECVHPHPSSIAMALLCHDTIVEMADGSELQFDNVRTHATTR